MSLTGHSAALRCALQSATRLWKDVYPLPTNLWAVTKVVEKPGSSGRPFSYGYLDGRDNQIIRKHLTKWVRSLPGASLRSWLEEDYLGKYATFRNWYQAVGLRNQAEVAPWFNFGGRLPKGFIAYLENFWRQPVDVSYKPRPFDMIRCPNSDASTGLAFTGQGWIYESDAGEVWPAILEGAPQVFETLEALAPSWGQLLNPKYRNPELEMLSIDTPVIRTEGGPLKIRWAQNHGKHLYVIERAMIEPLQEVFSESPAYIGKASHCRFFGMAMDSYRGKPFVGTHGDDWIAAIGGGNFVSGDWSTFDLRVTGRQIVASRFALAKVLRETASWSDEWDKVLRSLTYIASKGPTIWPWAKLPSGEYTLTASVRRKVGSVRSGSGDFVLHNNAINTAALRVLLEQGFSGWKRFSDRAWQLFGWVAKPSAQIASAEGFVACRSLFLREFDFRPLPCASSALRNWVRPAYDPLDGWNNLRVLQVTRIRELNSTLGYLPESDAEPLMRSVGEAALAAGVHDPWGQEYSDYELAVVTQKMHSAYSMSSFLET